jgi:hypothetical protein
MQQTNTASNTSTTSTISTKVTTADHTVAVPVSVTAAANSIPSNVKGGEQQFTASPVSTAAQVITVVAPSHTTQAHGQPVVVQVSSGGQFIAVAVSPESAGQTTNTQQSDAGTVASGVATASTDEDDGQSGFEDFATAAYTNGANSASAMFVI